MPISSETSKVIYTGDSATDIFPFTFLTYAVTELVVERITIADGTTDTGVLNTDYSAALTSTAPSAGNVTTIGDWASSSSAYKIVIRRVVPLTQEIDLTDNQGTPASTFEEGYDRAIMAIQQLQEQLDRSLLQSSDATSSIEFPAASGGKYLGWNSAATALENKTLADLDVLEKASVADAQAATDDAKYVTPSKVKSYTDTLAPTASVDGELALFSGTAGKTVKRSSQLGAGIVKISNAAAAIAVSGTDYVAFANTRMTVGTFTREISTTGTQAITGVGFTPVSVILLAAITSTSAMSFGLDNGVIGGSFADNNVATAGTYVFSTSQSASLQVASGIYANARVSSLDSNGFTLNWTKNGSPSGTATFVYLAFR